METVINLGGKTSLELIWMRGFHRERATDWPRECSADASRTQANGASGPPLLVNPNKNRCTGVC